MNDYTPEQLALFKKQAEEAEARERRWGYAHSTRDRDGFRAWWHVPAWLTERTGLRCLNVELGNNRRHRLCGVSFRIGEEPTFSFGFSVPMVVSFHVGADHNASFRLMEHFGKSSDMGCKYDGREVRVAIHDGAIWWNVWTSTSGWTSKRPRWRDGNFNPTDFLLGDEDYNKREIETVDRVVEMPEGPYPVTVTMFESTWKRPRWPRARRMVRAEVKAERGIPHPGKGENAWDCDEDATYSSTSPASNPDEAVESLRAYVLDRRRRYGGEGWLPERVG